MFKCKSCGSTEFQLTIHPEYAGRVQVHTNEYDEVVVKADSKEFIADLMFINQYGVCKSCEAIKDWEYHFPKRLSPVGSN